MQQPTVRIRRERQKNHPEHERALLAAWEMLDALDRHDADPGPARNPEVSGQYAAFRGVVAIFVSSLEAHAVNLDALRSRYRRGRAG